LTRNVKKKGEEVGTHGRVGVCGNGRVVVVVVVLSANPPVFIKGGIGGHG
jgi:acylphosphatase